MRNTLKNKLLMIAGFAVTVALTSQAAVISDWSFENVTGLVPDYTMPVGTTLIEAADNVVAADLTSTDLISGGSLRYENGGGADNSLNLKNFHITADPGRGEFYYTLTAASGKAINVNSLTMTSRRNGNGAPDNLKWWVSVDGGAFVQYGAEVTGVPVAEVTSTFTQSISGAVSVTFKFLLDNTSKNGNIHFTQIEVDGSVVDGVDLPPSILYFDADSESAYSNDTVTLSWDSVNEGTMTLDPGGIDVTGLTATNVTVTADTTYTLTANNAHGTDVETVEVLLITVAPAINSFTTSSTNVFAGESVTLSWDVDNVTALDLNGSDVTGLTSTDVVVAAETVYTLTASNPNGSTNTALTVTEKTTAPELVFSASKTNVAIGATVTLSWNVSGADSLVLDPGGIDVLAISSTNVVVTSESTYTLTAANSYGSTNASETITVFEAGDPIVNIDLTPNGAFSPTGDNLAGVIGVETPTWNAVSSSTNAYTNLVDENGFASTVGFEITSEIPEIGGFGAAGGAGQFFTSYLFLGNQTAETQASFTVSGLDDAKAYDLYFYATWAYIDAGTGFSVDGGATWVQTTGIPSVADADFVEGQSYVKIEGVPTDGSGNIDGLWKTVGPNHRGMFNALQIVESPANPGSPVTDLTISGPVNAGTGMVLSWTGETGKSYGVETNSNLITADWQTFETGLIGDGSLMSVTNTIGPDETFYRVISE